MPDPGWGRRGDYAAAILGIGGGRDGADRTHGGPPYAIDVWIAGLHPFREQDMGYQLKESINDIKKEAKNDLRYIDEELDGDAFTKLLGLPKVTI